MIRQGPRRLADDRIVIREIGSEDADDLYWWRMEARNRRMFHQDGPVELEAHRQFFRRYFEDGNEDAWFVVEDQGKPMGALALYRLSPGRWEAGRLAFDFAYRGLKGFRIAQRAVRLLQDYARAIGHGQMRCEVLEYNKTMLRIVESVGFVPVHSGERDGKRFFELVAPLGLRKSPPSESESGPL